MFDLKRRMLLGLFVSLGFLGGLIGTQMHTHHLGQIGPRVLHVAGDGQPPWPTSSSLISVR